MIFVIIRIALRYMAGALVTRGLIGSDDAAFLTNDPGIQTVMETGFGLLMGAASETWWWAAHKFGWAK